MNVLVTAGNTQVLLDKVRCLTNIFTGRTGAAIALEAFRRGHQVTLLTSHPEAVGALKGDLDVGADRWRHDTYLTFDHLRRLLEERVTHGGFDVVIHSAAVSDYLPAGTFAPAQGTTFDAAHATWHAAPGTAVMLVDRSAAKIKSDEPELWVRLVRAPKLVDMVRRDWGFRGILVKFKLEVDVTDEELLEIAERSRVYSGADVMVANTLDGAPHWAFLGARDGEYARIGRWQLADKLLDAVEALKHG